MITKNCNHCQREFETKRHAKLFCSRECANRAQAVTKADVPVTSVWSCGGGVDSTAIAVLITQGKLPKPDMALMTDVGWEEDSTWEHVTKVLRPRLAEVGVRLHVIKTSDYTNSNLIDPRGHVVLPAYRRNDQGEVIKFHTRCSGPWKLQVAKRWLREQGVQKCENWIGIAACESQRAKPSKQKWFGHRWPLIEFGMTREDCVYAIGEAGWPMAPRTSCVMCPQQTDGEWRRMAKRQPEEFARACKIEQEMRKQVPDVFLHRSCRPLAEWAEYTDDGSDDVDALPRECNPFTQCTEAACPKEVAKW